MIWGDWWLGMICASSDRRYHETKGEMFPLHCGAEKQAAFRTLNLSVKVWSIPLHLLYAKMKDKTIQNKSHHFARHMPHACHFHPPSVSQLFVPKRTNRTCLQWPAPTYMIPDKLMWLVHLEKKEKKTHRKSSDPTYSMDGFKGKFTGKPHNLNGKIYGFRFRFSTISLKPIHSRHWDPQTAA